MPWCENTWVCVFIRQTYGKKETENTEHVVYC